MPRLPTAAELGARPTPQPVTTSPQFEERPVTGAGSAAGEAIARAGARISEAGELYQARQDALARVRALGEFDETVAKQIEAFRTASDLTDPETARKFGSFLTQTVGSIVDNHAGSLESRQRLAATLADRRTGYAGTMAQFARDAQREMIVNALGSGIRSLSVSASENPSDISTFIATLDERIDDMAPAMAPEQEMEYRDVGRREIVLSALNGFLSMGRVEEARALLDETPELSESLTPAQYREIQNRFAAYDAELRSAQTTARRKIEELRVIIGRDPTQAELARAAGLGPSTETAKTIEDRQRFVAQYGENSPQVRMFDQLEFGEAEPSLSDEAGIRKEFTAQSKDFVLVRDAFGRIAASAQNPSPAGDLALMFNYMKMLDPGSVVRESEFAQIASTGSFGERLQAAAQKYLSGERLTVEQRSDFTSRAESLMRQQLDSQLQLEDEFRGIAERSELRTANVVVDFVGPYRRLASDSSGDPPPADPPAGDIPRIESDADYEALPPGAVFIDPEGVRRRKP